MTAEVTFAVVGAGYWGPNVIRTIVELPGTRLGWVCDLSEGRRQYIADRHPGVPVTAEIDQILRDPSVDAIAIVTPVTTHRSLAEMALRAGKHVFIEKPLASSIVDALAIERAGEKAKRLVAVGHLFVHHPAVVAMRELSAAGRFGVLHYAESGRVNLGPPASEVDVLWDLLVHDIAILVALGRSDPASVAAVGRRFAHPSLTDVVFVTLEFDDGFVSVHHASWLAPTKVRRFFVAGSDGSATFDDTSPDRKLVVSDRGVDSRIGLRAEEVKELYYGVGEVEVPELGTEPPLSRQLREFAEAVRTGGQTTVGARQGIDVVRILESAQRSIADGGRRVYLERESSVR